MPGEQFYVTHCTVADSVLNDPGYTVRAASTKSPDILDKAFRYPPYELPIEMWKSSPKPWEAPNRLARTEDSAAGIWVAHTAYLPKDTTGRDRSYFSHLLHLPAADPAAVLRSWASQEWVTDYPAGATKTLPGNAKLPVGNEVSDDAVTAFLGDNPSGTFDVSSTVCPSRLRWSVTERRTLFARVLQAVLLLSEEKDRRRRRLYIHAEPGVVALLLYGAVRLLPQLVTARLTFSTYEAHHRNIRGYELADVIGTYMGAPELGLDADLGTSRGWALDTFWLLCSSPELQKPLPELLPPGLSELIKVAARGGWTLIDEIHQKVLGRLDARDWLAEAGAYARGGAKPEIIAVAERLPTPSVPAWPAPMPPPAVPMVRQQRPFGTKPYTAQINRANPACLLFLVDQSKSMSDPFIGGIGQTKAAVVADALNRLIQNVVLRSAKGDGVRDYFRVGVIGYGQGVKAGMGGSIPFNVLIPVSQLGSHPLRVESRTKLALDSVGGTVEQRVLFPVWFDAEAGGKTPMCAAFEAAVTVVKGFVEQFPNSFPPIVLNLTDGMPSDGDPQPNARTLRQINTSDGNTLLFNLLISSKPVQADYFPATETHMADVCSKLLFRMASQLPPKLWDAAKAEGHPLQPKARGVVLNADPTAIVRFLDIGTRVTSPGK